MDKIKEWLVGFRKFTFGIIFITLSVIFLLQGFIDGKIWAEVCRDVTVAFMGTNLAEHIIKVGKDYINAKTK